MKKIIAILLAALMMVLTVTVYADYDVDSILNQFTQPSYQTDGMWLCPPPVPKPKSYEEQVKNQEVAAYLGDAIVGRTVTIGDRGVGVRSGPGTTYTEIGKLHAGATATVCDVEYVGNGTWYQIYYNGGYGWISAGYVVLH